MLLNIYANKLKDYEAKFLFQETFFALLFKDKLTYYQSEQVIQSMIPHSLNIYPHTFIKHFF